MKKHSVRNIYVSLLMFVIPAMTGCSGAMSQGISADDFRPKDAGGSEAVAAPENIQTETIGNREVLVAETMQDAINAAAEKIEKASVAQPANAASTDGFDGELREMPQSFYIVKSEKTGNIGFVATGMAVEPASTAPNPDYVRKAQQRAFVIAYLQAQRNLVSGWKGANGEARQFIVTSTKDFVNKDQTLQNFRQQMSENASETINGVIRGYQVKSTNLIPGDGGKPFRIVTIYCTLNSLLKPQCLDKNTLVTDDFNTAIEDVKNQIRKGLLLPCGARQVVTSKGEVAFIGYASEVILNTSPERANQNYLTAKRKAELRASRELAQSIHGGKLIATGSVSAESDAIDNDFIEKINKNDPMAELSDDSVQRVKQQKDTFRSSLSDIIEITSKGERPAGSQQMSFRTDNWAFEVFYYIPSVSNFIKNEEKKITNPGATAPPKKVGPLPTGEHSVVE